MPNGMWRTWAWVGVGVLIGMATEATIGAMVNPVLASLKLSV